MLNDPIKQFLNSDAPFVVAEISANHCGSLKKIYKLLEVAKKVKVSAVKIQTFSPDCMTLNHDSNEFFIKDKKNLWNGSKLYDLYRKNQTNFSWHKKIFHKAKKLNLTLFSSPFSEEAVDLLEDLNCPMYKIASFELNHFPLLKKLAKTKKPIIMSTGMATLKEIKKSYNFLKKNGTKSISLLKCTSSYPASYSDMNLLTIQKLKEIFNCKVGISDHSLGIGPSIASIYFGSTIIEKHFTLDKKKSPDGLFSLDEKELDLLIRSSKAAFQAKGIIKFGPTVSEKRSIKRRRSIYVSSFIKKGERFTKKNIKVIRPANGLDPIHYYDIIGKKASKNCDFGSPFKMNMISK